MIVRVSDEGKPAFQLRKGEEGISAFDPDLVLPPLEELEILSAFRSGSVLIMRRLEAIEAKGLHVEQIEGAETLPERLKNSHVEIRPQPGMSRAEFKQALRELE